MLLKYQLVFVIVLFCGINAYSQYHEVIEKNASEYMLSLAENGFGSSGQLANLRSSLYGTDELLLTRVYNINDSTITNLKNHFYQYENSIKNISQDSALVLFNRWYLHFRTIFYKYSEEKFFASDKIKLLFFSTSMSCQCTLDMCREQTIEILDFAKRYNLDYWIVDSYEDNQLQLKYESYFAPSLIVIGTNNEVLVKIENDENMIASLTEIMDKTIKIKE